MIILKKINNLKRDLQNRYIEIRNLKLWISKKINNPEYFKDYFSNKNIKKVAVSGNNTYSDILIEELINAGIRIEYIIAPLWSTNPYGIPMYSDIQKQISIDAIVSTSIPREVYDNHTVISLFDILYQK